MTHTTNQERAEVRKAIESALADVHIEDGTIYWFERIVEEVTTAVMSTRRAPVVPQGWVLVPEEASSDMVNAGEDAFCGTYDYAMIPDVYAAMLSAAPQPPEAAPVQMPEPAAYLHECWKKPSLRTLEFSKVDIQLAAKGYKSIPLYTEHQVRQLLAQHSIK